VTSLGTYQNLDGISRIYGLEVSAQAVFDELSIDTGLSLIHSELGHALLSNALGQPVDTEGKPQPFTPDITLHAGAQYAFPLDNETSLTPRIDVAYVGNQTMTPIDQIIGGIPLERVPPHTLVNLKLTYGTDKWNGEFYVTNVTNRIYIQSHGGPGYNAYPNEPRRIGFLLHYNF
jgi:iron complex outermembrane receptor protein